MTQVPDAETLKSFNLTIADEFRANGGKVGGPFEGADLLLLTTTGAKSGRSRMSPLAYLRVDDRMLIIGSLRGADVHPAWVHNLRANPRAHIEVGTAMSACAKSRELESYDVVARELPPDERERSWAQIVAVAPWFADYQAKTSRVIPLFELAKA